MAQIRCSTTVLYHRVTRRINPSTTSGSTFLAAVMLPKCCLIALVRDPSRDRRGIVAQLTTR